MSSLRKNFPFKSLGSSSRLSVAAACHAAFRRLSVAAACHAAVLFFLLGCIPPFAATAVDSPNSPTNWTPLLVSIPQRPSLFPGSDHKYNLVYELYLNNYNNRPVTLEEIAIRDDETGRTILTVSGDMLKNALYAHNKTNKFEIAAGNSAVVFLHLDFDRAEEAPRRLRHRVVYNGINGLDVQTKFVNDELVFDVDPRKPVKISPPLRGGPWLASGGYTVQNGHRRALLAVNNRLVCAQRYAIDWALLDDKNRFAVGLEREKFPSYGQPVYAVADGTIVAAFDSFRDQTPFHADGDERSIFAGGNCVVEKIGGGNFAVYAHLQPGSLKVKTGQTVRKGHVLAQVGNSGNTSGPHLHFEVVDAPSLMNARGLPYVFDRFTVDGFVPNDGTEEDAINAKPMAVTTSPFDGPHRLEIPRARLLIRFD
jgi:hypothetical protein